MSFLAILFALLLDQGLRHLEGLRAPRWFGAYLEAFAPMTRQSRVNRAVAVALVVVGVPTLVTLFLSDVLAHIWSGFGLIFAVVVLLFSLGPHDLHAQAEAYADALQADDEARAAEAAQSLLERPSPEDPSQRTQAVTQAVLAEANARLFGVLFWFGWLGPAGAALFRCADLLRRASTQSSEPEFQGAAERLYGVLAWAPAHLVALGYALSGSFDDALADLRAYYNTCTLRFYQLSEGVLVSSGLGAIRVALDEEAGLTRLKSALGLVRRTLIIWLVIEGLLTIFGWSW